MRTEAEPGPVTLYTYAMSPYAAKVHCFLLYQRIPFECFYINPLRVKQDLPLGRQIPVVTIGGECRADSTPIGLWLDERFPSRIPWTETSSSVGRGPIPPERCRLDRTACGGDNP